MDVLSILKENAAFITPGQQYTGSMIVLIAGVIACLAALAILIYCIRFVSSVSKKINGQDKQTAPAIPVPVQTAVQSPAPAESEDEGELVAVITAAITAMNGSGNVQIKSIRENGNGRRVSNWAVTGRLMAFESRKVTKK